MPKYDFDMAIFNKGTKPEIKINANGIDLIRKALIETVPLLRKELNNIVSVSVQESIRNLVENDNTLHFILFHENIHFAKIQKLLLSLLEYLKVKCSAEIGKPII